MDFGHVKFIRPKHLKLDKLVKGYYVHVSDKPDFYSRLTFYQNITTTISIYKDSETNSENRLRKQSYKQDNGFRSLLVGLVDKYQEVEFYGPVNRLAIVFYPGGINHFIKPPLSHFLEKHYSHFSYFEDAFKTFLPLVYNEPSIEKKRDYLDQFLLDNYEAFDEPEILEAIRLLTNDEHVMKVQDLANKLDISRRTLLRKFKKHLGYSIEEYISVIKFRKALLNFQKSQESNDLTQIAYDSNYYDQADFNHQMKSRSGLTPKELFRQLDIVDDTLFWKA